MEIKRTSKGIKVYLSNFPTTSELKELNYYAKFRLCEQKGYKRLLVKTHPYTEMEAPIKEWFYV